MSGAAYPLVATRRLLIGILALAVVFALVPSLTAAQSSRPYDAFALAIQHFNAKHDRALDGWGPEHQFMIAVLEAVDSAVPILRHFSKPAVSSGLPFRSLWTSAYRAYDTTAVARAQQDTLREIATRLGQGCPADSTVQRWHSLGSHGVGLIVHDSIRYTFGSDGPVRACQHPLAAIIARYGINYLTFSDVRYDSWWVAYELTIGEARGTLRDMVFVRRRLLADSATAWLAKRLHPWKLDAESMPPWDILLEDSSGSSGLTDPLRLRYSFRAGDCNPGCGERFAWLVDVTPTQQATELQGSSQPRFRVRVREQGVRLTPQERRQLLDSH